MTSRSRCAFAMAMFVVTVVAGVNATKVIVTVAEDRRGRVLDRRGRCQERPIRPARCCVSVCIWSPLRKHKQLLHQYVVSQQLSMIRNAQYDRTGHVRRCHE
jgi:hypothetical protein